MFTGLVEELGTVVAVDPVDGGGARILVDARLAAELTAGDSVAVNGVCLTAVDPGTGSFGADAMGETLARSSLGALAAGDRVNLELPLAAGDRMGGHIVQGHVDAVGEVAAVRADGNASVVRITAPAEVMRYIVEKGSIAVDGVSLTVAALGDDWFELWLIPETCERTRLGAAVPGMKVNLEVDVLAKYVEKLMVR